MYAMYLCYNKAKLSSLKLKTRPLKILGSPVRNCAILRTLLELRAVEDCGQCYKTFYRGNLPPLHVNTIVLCYKAILPWKLPLNGSKLLQYFNPRKLGLKLP
jgi:hypothetical protein